MNAMLVCNLRFLAFKFIYFFFKATDMLMFVDGTDEANEGEWVFTSTNEQPYLPFNSDENVGNTYENCLDFTSINSLLDRPCSLIFNRSVICEYECKLCPHPKS